MNNKQQTAVEWLADEIPTIDWTNDPYWQKKLQQAKEMEKEQKADTWNNAINAVEKDKWESFEQFYDLTYGGNK